LLWPVVRHHRHKYELYGTSIKVSWKEINKIRKHLHGIVIKSVMLIVLQVAALRINVSKSLVSEFKVRNHHVTLLIFFFLTLRNSSNFLYLQTTTYSTTASDRQAPRT